MSEREFNSFIAQFKNFLLAPFLAAENLSWLLKDIKSLRDKQHILTIQAIGILKTTPVASLTTTLESGEAFAMRRLSPPSSTQYQPSLHTYEAFWIRPEGNGSTIEKTIYDDNGKTVSSVKYNIAPRDVLNYLEKETKGFSLLDDFRSFHGYRTAKRDRVSSWYAPIEADSGSGFFLPIVYPILDSSDNFLGATLVFVPVSSFSHMGKMLATENRFSEICIFNSQEKIILCSSEPTIYHTNPQGQRLVKSIQDLKNPQFQKSYHIYKDKGEPNFFVLGNSSIDDATPLTYFQKLPTYTDWTLAMTFNKSLISQGIQKDIYHDLWFLIGKIIIFVSIIVWLSHFLSTPLRKMAFQMKAMSNLQLTNYTPKRSFLLEIQNLLSAFHTINLSLSIFQKYIPRSLVQALSDQNCPLAVGGTRNEMSIFFCHLKNFSHLLQDAPAEYVFHYLYSYFDPFTKIVSDQKGTLDKYMGDGLMAFWGAPAPQKDHAVLACETALSCLNLALGKLNPSLVSQERPPLDLAFGIATGYTVSGIAGSSDRLQYSAFGDTVNLSSRLKDLNTYYKTHILVNEATYLQASHLFFFRPIDYVRVHGKEKPVLIYELLAPYDLKLVGPISQKVSWSIRQYMEFILLIAHGWEAYKNRSWEKAEQFYKKALGLSPDDHVAQIFIQRCQYFQKNPPSSWDGVYEA